jgi:hypothetical protein
MVNLDYQPILRALKTADQVFTEKNGITHYSEFDAALEAAAVAYNKDNRTAFDPVEARHQYLYERCVDMHGRICTNYGHFFNFLA